MQNGNKTHTHTHTHIYTYMHAYIHIVSLISYEDAERKQHLLQ
jgi:hypothetical protein